MPRRNRFQPVPLDRAGPPLSNLFYKLRREALDHLKQRIEAYRQGVITLYATDLFNNCPLRIARHLQGELGEDRYKENLLGHAVHRLLDDADGDSIVTEYPLYRELNVDGYKVIILGRVDAYIPKSNTAIEVKTFVSRYTRENLPLESHIAQARVYNWLGEFYHTELVYIDLLRHRAYNGIRVSDRYGDDEVVEEVRRLLSGRPDTRHCWKCPFKRSCRYAT